MVGNMVDCHNGHGAAYVVIGTSGKGVAPHYRVAPGHNWLDGVNEEFLDDQSPFKRASHGRNHELLP